MGVARKMMLRIKNRPKNMEASRDGRYPMDDRTGCRCDELKRAGRTRCFLNQVMVFELLHDPEE
jgi:hypothetical protein